MDLIALAQKTGSLIARMNPQSILIVIHLLLIWLELIAYQVNKFSNGKFDICKVFCSVLPQFFLLQIWHLIRFKFSQG